MLKFIWLEIWMTFDPRINDDYTIYEIGDDYKLIKKYGDNK